MGVRIVSPEKIDLVERIENLRNRIDYLRNEIWKRDTARMTADQLEHELEKLLIEYKGA